MSDEGPGSNQESYGYVGRGVQPQLSRRTTSHALDDALYELEQARGRHVEYPIDLQIAALDDVRLDMHYAALENVPGADERLLAMLGEIAAGADGDDDVLSNGIVEFLPTEVQFDDPPMKAMIDECGAMWEALQEEIARKQDFHQRKLAELRRMQKQNDEQQQESESLRNRLQSARQSLGERLENEYFASQQLRQKMNDERCGMEQLRASLTSAMEKFATREELVRKESAEEDAAQASLMEELQAATDQQTCLQSELEDAKSALHYARRRSVDIQASIAEERDVAKDSEVRLQSELRDAMDRRALFASNAFGGGFWNLADAGDQQQGVDDDPDIEALHASRLQQSCVYQSQQLEVLKAELAAEEASDKQLCTHLAAMRALIAADAEAPEPFFPANSGLACPDVAAWREGMGHDATAEAEEVEALFEKLSRKEQEVLTVAEEEREARSVLQSQLQQLTDLQEQLLNEEDACEEHEQSFAQANMGLEDLRHEVLMEHESLRQEEVSSEKRRQMFRALIEEQRILLRSQRAANNQLFQHRRKRGSRFRFGSTPNSRTSKGSQQSPSFHIPIGQDPGHSPGVASDGWLPDGMHSPA